MPTLVDVVIHGNRTRRSQYFYQFTPKHHGSDPHAAQWLPSLSLEEEFGVFDQADENNFVDEDDRLYGVLQAPDGGLAYLGTWNQQVAEFPNAREGEAWHGYPLYPLIEFGPENRRGQKGRPAKVVFDQMVNAGLITTSQRRRLLKGDHA